MGAASRRVGVSASSPPSSPGGASPGGASPSPPRERAPSHRMLAPALRRRAALAEVAYLAGLLLAAGAIYSTLVLLPCKLKTRDLLVQRDALAAEVQDLKGSIALLRRDTSALHDDPWVVERALRRRLGFLRTGECVFRPAGT